MSWNPCRSMATGSSCRKCFDRRGIGPDVAERRDPGRLLVGDRPDRDLRDPHHRDRPGLLGELVFGVQDRAGGQAAARRPGARRVEERDLAVEMTVLAAPVLVMPAADPGLDHYGMYPVAAVGVREPVQHLPGHHLEGY